MSDIEDRFAKIGHRINRVEIDVYNLGSALWNAIDKLNHKLSGDEKPYKCPVCDGKGNTKKEVAYKVLEFKFCIACVGKGIVWG